MSIRPLRIARIVAPVAILIIATVSSASAEPPQSLHDRLKATPIKIAWEAYIDGNSDIFVMNADGSGKVNLTNTPDVNEHYPQISPDGTKICYTVDTGEGRAGGSQPVDHGYRWEKSPQDCRSGPRAVLAARWQSDRLFAARVSRSST